MSKKNLQMAWFARQLAECRPEHEILELAMSHWKVGRQRARKLLDLTHDYLAQVNSRDRGRCRQRMELLLLRTAQEAGESFSFAAKVAALGQLAKIQGLHEPERIELSGHVTTSPSPRADMLRERLRQLAGTPELRERAIKLGLDLGEIELIESGE